MRAYATASFVLAGIVMISTAAAQAPTETHKVQLATNLGPEDFAAALVGRWESAYLRREKANILSAVFRADGACTIRTRDKDAEKEYSGQYRLEFAASPTPQADTVATIIVKRQEGLMKLPRVHFGLHNGVIASRGLLLRIDEEPYGALARVSAPSRADETPAPAGADAVLTAENFVRIREFIFAQGRRQTYCSMFNNNPYFPFDGFHMYLNPTDQGNINCEIGKSEFPTLVIQAVPSSDQDRYRLVQPRPAEYWRIHLDKDNDALRIEQERSTKTADELKNEVGAFFEKALLQIAAFRKNDVAAAASADEERYPGLIINATSVCFYGVGPPESELKTARAAMALLLEDKDAVGAYIIRQLKDYDVDQRFPFLDAWAPWEALTYASYGIVLREFGLEYIKKLEPAVLRSPNEEARVAGTYILAGCGSKELRKTAIDLLVAVLKRDDSPKVQAAAIHGFYELRAAEHSELIAPYLSSEHPQIRHVVLAYYDIVHLPDIIEPLKARLDIEKEPDVAFLLAQTVCKYDHSSARVLISHATPGIRCGALHYLAESSTDRTEEDHAAVAERIGVEEDLLCRYEIAEALSRWGDARCLELFIGILKGPENPDRFGGGSDVKCGAATRLVNLTNLPFRVTDEDHRRRNEKRGSQYDGIAAQYDAWWRANRDRVIWSKGKEGSHWMFRVREEEP